MPMGSKDQGPGNGVRYWDCPAEYFTIGVNMLRVTGRRWYTISVRN
jgi:hypothetical protein